MVVRIRLGCRNRPFYRLMATTSRPSASTTRSPVRSFLGARHSLLFFVCFTESESFYRRALSRPQHLQWVIYRGIGVVLSWENHVLLAV
jgi:hypothetical protein